MKIFLFLFVDLHRFLVENQDSADVKTFFLIFFWSSPIVGGKTELCGRGEFFFWSSPIFGGKTELCGREDLFFGLHQFWGYTSESVNCPWVPMNKKFGKLWAR